MRYTYAAPARPRLQARSCNFFVFQAQGITSCFPFLPHHPTIAEPHITNSVTRPLIFLYVFIPVTALSTDYSAAFDGHGASMSKA